MRVLLSLVAILSYLMVAPSSGASNAPADEAILRAVFPHGTPTIPYTSYRYNGSLACRAAIVARAPSPALGLFAQVVVITVRCRPSSGGYPDDQGRVEVAEVRGAGSTWQVLTSSGLLQESSFAGSVANGAVLSSGLNSGDLGIRYTVTLSGSGSPSTTYLRIYRRSGTRLGQQLAMPIDSHIGIGACCDSGSSAVVRPASAYRGAPAYAVTLAGYAGGNTSNVRYDLPGTVLYVAGKAGYKPAAYLEPNLHLHPMETAPVVVALQSQKSDADMLRDPARAYLPGAAPALTGPDNAHTKGHLFATWSTQGLRLTIQTSVGWPAKTIPRRIDVYAQRDGAGRATHTVLTGAALGCRPGTGYLGTGYTCAVNVPAQALWSHLELQPASNNPSGRNAARYSVGGVTRIALRLEARGPNGIQTLTLDRGTTVGAPGKLNTLVLLRPT